jgi:hypothetical protein
MYPRSVDRAASGSTKTACADVRASEAVGAIRQWVSPRPRSLPAVRETRSLSASTLPGLPIQPVHASRDGSFLHHPSYLHSSLRDSRTSSWWPFFRNLFVFYIEGPVEK